MAGFLAYIIPISEGVPTHPIAPGGQPPGTWGGGNVPMPSPPIANVPGAPGYRPPTPGAHPEHPIVYPPEIWGPTDPRPGYGLPGRPPGTWGGAGEPFPTPPIVIPPTQPGQPPLVIWGPGDPRPTPPIELPGGGNPPEGGEPVRLVEWHTAWTEETGWIVVGTPTVPHVTPSKK